MALNAFNASIHQVIDQLKPIADVFFDCLQQEATCIAKGSAIELEEVANNKQQLSQQLEQASKECNHLLSQHQCDLQALLNGSDAIVNRLDQPTKQALSALNDKLTASFELNQANGIAVQTLSKINRFTLNLITGQNPSVKLYGAKGTTEKPHRNSGAKLGEA
ncbi:hypothetical protein THMIRHAS_08730 [Thiosulfatimonas sediminis]|uniref:Flagellar protein FlgN n=1 Tax=Thiosulfatimonas sediminis TaxID=2675054 RepID=A0A6F8PU47_9GAMM|nr:flagellar protein FlgN [Thiosulfatimonas sediminis]BBP45500.1 hypothetical protein THMIRHAS_08730 [Thiosulfatimonas sediminis]